MPSARAQAARNVHRIPVVQAALLRQGLQLVAGIDVRTVVATSAVTLAVHRSCARGGRRPLPVSQARRNDRTVGIHRSAQVLREPALVADLHHGICVFLCRRTHTHRCQRQAAAVIGVGFSIVFEES